MYIFWNFIIIGKIYKKRKNITIQLYFYDVIDMNASRIKSIKERKFRYPKQLEGKWVYDATNTEVNKEWRKRVPPAEVFLFENGEIYKMASAASSVKMNIKDDFIKHPTFVGFTGQTNQNPEKYIIYSRYEETIDGAFTITGALDMIFT